MSREYSNLEKVRLEKLDRLRKEGIDPYPAHAERTHTNLEAIQAFESVESEAGDQSVGVTLVGRLRSMRPMGKITFAHIEDSSGRVQLFLRGNELGTAFGNEKRKKILQPQGEFFTSQANTRVP